MKLHHLALIKHIYTNNFQSFYLSKQKYTMVTEIKISTKILAIPVVVCTSGKGLFGIPNQPLPRCGKCF